MKKKIRMFFPVVTLVCLLTACNQNTREEVGMHLCESESANQTVFDNECVSDLDYTHQNEVSNEYSETSDKITLRFACDFLFGMDQNTMEELNAYLDAVGCEYEVIFETLDMDIDASTKEYADYLKKYVDQGNGVDLCYLGNFSDGTSDLSYRILAKDGYLLSLNEYLVSVDGRDLYEALPTEKWNALSIDGQIYGVNGYPYAGSVSYAYIVNKEIMETCKLTEEDLRHPIDDLVPLLEMIQRKYGTDFSTINYMTNFQNQFATYQGLTNLNNQIATVCLDESVVNSSECPIEYKLENAQYRQFLEGTYEVAMNPNVNVTVSDTINYDYTFLNLVFNGVAPGRLLASSYGYYSENKKLEQNDFCVIYPENKNIAVGTNLSAISVMKTSSHSEEALDFLKRVYSDPELSSLFSYKSGYFEKDGRAYVLTSDGKEAEPNIINSWFRGNGFINLPAATEVKSKDEIYEFYEAYAYVTPYADFWFEEDCQEARNRSNQVLIEGLSCLYDGSVSDFDSYMEELNEQVKMAGAEYIYSLAKLQWSRDHE